MFLQPQVKGITSQSLSDMGESLYLKFRRAYVSQVFPHSSQKKCGLYPRGGFHPYLKAEKIKVCVVVGNYFSHCVPPWWQAG